MARKSFLYRKVYEDIKLKIDEEIYAEGTKLPSDDELTGKYGVSLITVKKALNILRDEGLVQRIPGRGTIVTKRGSQAIADAVKDDFESNNNFKTIGIVVEHVSSSFGLDLIYRIDRKAEEKGYKTIIRFSYYDRQKETDEIEFLVKSKISGLIVMPCHGLYYNRNILKLILENFPVVVIDKKLEGISVPTVRTDNRQAVKTLVKHLWEQGCKKLVFISPQIVGTSSLKERRKGFYEAAAELSVTTFPECTLTFDENIYVHEACEENITKVADYLAEYKDKIDGIICTEYSLIPAILQASERTSAKVGDTIKIGCIDGPEGLFIPHMKQDEIKMAEIIVDLIISQINKSNTEMDILVPAMLKTGE